MEASTASFIHFPNMFSSQKCTRFDCASTAFSRPSSSRGADRNVKPLQSSPGGFAALLIHLNVRPSIYITISLVGRSKAKVIELERQSRHLRPAPSVDAASDGQSHPALRCGARLEVGLAPRSGPLRLSKPP